MVTVFCVDGFQRGNRAYHAGLLLVADLQIKGSDQIPYHQLVAAAGFDVRVENLIGSEAADIFHLICKDTGLGLIGEVIVNHAPYRGFAGAGSKRHGLNRVLTVEDVVDAVAPTDLDGVDLIDIEVMRGKSYLPFG